MQGAVMKILASILALLLVALAFGQGGYVGPKGYIGPNGYVGGVSGGGSSPPTVVQAHIAGGAFGTQTTIPFSSNISISRAALEYPILKRL